MVGALILALVIVVMLPVGVMVAGLVLSALLGQALAEDGDSRHEGSELVELGK
jgi:hypothetical protein